MYRLFPKAKAYLILGCAATILFVGALAYDRTAWHVVVAVAACGVLASWLFAELYAAAQHHKLLLLLYRLLKPREFVALYEPLPETKGLRPRVRLTLLAYLSNGYAAFGDFARAQRILDKAAELPCCKRGNGLALLTGNRCAIHLACGETAPARNCLDDLKREIAGMRPGKSRRTLEETCAMLDACLAIVERRCTHNDAVLLEKRLNGNPSPLYALELRFWLARAHAALGENELAVRQFERVSAAGEELWVGRQALKLMQEQTSTNN